MPDIVDLIRAEHERIRYLFARLSRGDAHDADDLTRTWAMLSRLLETHIDAVEEIGYPPVPAAVMDIPRRRAQMAAHGDIREAMREARLCPVASRGWWLAVRAAWAAAMRHISVTEPTLLDELRQDVPLAARETLAEQWRAFVAARALDARDAQRRV